MTDDLMMAILAMDAYNRGDRDLAAFETDTVGNVLGSFSVGTTSEKTGYSSKYKDDSFYAVRYDSTSSGTVIAYRGTDSVWDVTTGWPIGTGLLTAQAFDALSFYKEVTGGTTANVSFTGHSLGGGLAGLAAYLTRTSATIFDSMSYDVAASRIVDQWNSYIRGDITLAQYQMTEAYLVFGESFAPNPSLPAPPIKSISVAGQALGYINTLFPDITLYTAPDVSLSPLQKHSQSLLVILQYAKDSASFDWTYAARWILPSLFSDYIAGRIEEVEALRAPSSSMSDIMRSAIAYSAIPDSQNGVQPFGNTGIKSLFDDARDLGRIVANPHLKPSFSGDFGTLYDLSRYAVQFAGQLAVSKINASDSYDKASSINGVLSIGGEGTPQTVAVDLSKRLWVDTAGAASVDGIAGRDKLINDAFDAAQSPRKLGSITLGASKDDDVLKWGMTRLYGSSDPLIAVDRVVMPVVDMSTQGLTTVIGERALTPSAADGASLLGASDFADSITGTAGKDILVGKSGDDTLDGGAGDDLLLGGAGNDLLKGGLGTNFLAGGEGYDTVQLGGSATGVNVTPGLINGEAGEKYLILNGGTSGTDTLADVEKILLTDKKDTLTFTQDFFRQSQSLKEYIGVDMGFSDRQTNFMANVDTLDLSQLNSAVYVYGTRIGDLGTMTWSRLSVTGYDKVIATSKDDLISVYGPATLVETGAGHDLIEFTGNNVAITDMSADDALVLDGNVLHGGLRNLRSNSVYATQFDGKLKFGINTLNELQIIYDNGLQKRTMWVLDYGATRDAPNPAGGIYLYQFEMAAYRLLDPELPSDASVMSTWSFAFGYAMKTKFGVSYWKGVDPLVLDLDDDGLELTAASTATPRIDIDGDLYAEHAGWVKGDDGILVRDLNGNGTIDPGTELVGNVDEDGYTALGKLDRNLDGKVDASDDIEDLNGNGVVDGGEQIIANGQHFSDLRVWKDLNQDGVAGAGEIFTLSELGIQSLSVAHASSSSTANNNSITAIGTFTRTDGTTGTTGDVVLGLDNIHTTYTGAPINITAAAAALPDLRGQGTLVSLREAMSLSDSARVAVANALSGLTDHHLSMLREQALPILEAWALASPLGDGHGGISSVPLKAHSDIHLLIKTNAHGHESVADFAYQTTNTVTDSEGHTSAITYWASAKGSVVKDAQGVVIPYPALSEVLGGDVGEGKHWLTISGGLISVAERLIGEDLPFDRLQPEGTTGLADTFVILDSFLSTINLMAVRLAVQGGALSEYFSGIAYQTDSNNFHATTSRELAPVFQALLEQAETRSDGLGWIKSWTPFLDVVIGDYVRQAGSDVLNTFGFIAQTLVDAFETAHSTLDFTDVAEAFGVDRDVLVEGSGHLAGSNESDILYSATANFTLSGSEGADDYVIGHAVGQSVVDDYEAPLGDSYDILRFAFLKPDDITAYRENTDLILTVNGTTDTLRILRQFEGDLPGLSGSGDYSEGTGVNEIVFADGTVWSKYDMAKSVSHPDGGATTLTGTSAVDVLDGGAGDDLLIGEGSGDVYIYAVGYGNDRIVDVEDAAARQDLDVLVLKGLTPEDIQYERNGSSDDLTIRIKATGETVSIQNEFRASYTGVIGKKWFSQVDAVEFEDMSSVSATDIMHTLVARAKTDGNDTIYGFSISDTLDGGAGDDFLSGGNEDDLYIFGRGYGHDTIWDNMDMILSGHDDTLAFGEGIAMSDVVFARLGETNNLTVSLTGADDIVTIRNFYDVTETGVFGAWARDLIENFDWFDGSHMSWQEVMLNILLASETDGNDLILGTHYDDVINGKAGDDTLKGGDGSDTYTYGYGSGNDTIRESFESILTPNEDTVAFQAGITKSNVALERTGSGLQDLKITLTTSETLTIVDQFYYGGLNIRPGEVEHFQFADNTGWTAAELRQEYLGRAQTSGDDHIIGFWSDDTLTAGPGNDTLEGGDGNDTYLIGADFGNVVIRETVSVISYGNDDSIVFSQGLNKSDVRFQRTNDDLTITFSGYSGQITVQNEFGHINHNWTLWNDGWWDIEYFKFYDGTTWTISDIRDLLIAQASTSGNDTIIGFYTNDTLDGGAGDDLLEGLEGADTYIFGRGYGHDTVWETGGAFLDPDQDRVLFNADVAFADLAFGRDGNDLVITITDTGDSLRVKNQFSWWLDKVDSFQFANGARISADDIDIWFADTANANSGNDTLSGTSGDDTLQGGAGSDTYMFGPGSGHDVVVDEGDSSSLDRVFLFDTTTDGLVLSRLGNDLILTIQLTGDTLRIENQFLSPGSGTGIERIYFADGTIWGTTEITQKAWFKGTDGNDTFGTSSSPLSLSGITYDPGKGDDTINSSWANAIAVAYASGDGNDSVRLWDHGDSNNVLKLIDLNPADVQLSRSGNNLIVTDTKAGGSITVQDEFSDTWFGITRILFADGTTMERSAFLANAWFRGTNGQDILGTQGNAVGFSGVTYALGKGDDAVYSELGKNITVSYTSGDGNDTYHLWDRSESNNVLKLTSLNATNVLLSRVGNDLAVRDLRSGQVITIQDQFSDTWFGITQVVFADGSTMERSSFTSNAWIRGSTGSDVYGTSSNPTHVSGVTYDLGIGDDRVYSDEANNITAIYASGDGNDTYRFWDRADANNTLKLADLTADQVRLSRRGKDLLVTDKTTGSSVTITDQFADTWFGISRILFADGSAMERSAFVANAWILGTLGNDALGTSSSPYNYSGVTYDPYLGDDTIYSDWANGITVVYASGGGNDTYRFWDHGDSNNTLKLLDLNASEVQLSRSGNAMLVTDKGTGQNISIADQFSDTWFGIARIAFADGSTMERSAFVANAWFRGTSGDDTFGTSSSPHRYSNVTYAPGKGNDTLYSDEAINITIMYASGDGDDTYRFWNRSNAVSVLKFEDLNSTSVQIGRAGNSLVVIDSNTGSTLTIQDQFSDTWFGIGSIVFADGSTMDRTIMNQMASNLLVGTASDDTINGTDNAETITGLAGSDILRGYGGSDTLTGGAGADFLFGGEGDDSLLAAADDDWLDGGVGADSMDGGAGYDWVTYADSQSPVVVDRLSPSNNIGDAAGDSFANIEAFALSAYSDKYVGNNETIQIFAGAGNDTVVTGIGNDWIDGGAGADSIDGGTGFDWVGYRDATSAVVIDRSNDANNMGDAAGDVYTNVEAFELSAYNDRYVGNNSNIEVFGEAGNDTIISGSGDDWINGGAGADSVDGGAGWDYFSYSDATSAVTLDMVTPANNTGDAAGDVLENFEVVQLSSFNDRYVGNGGNESIEGGAGDDTILAGSGDNWLNGGAGADSLDGGDGYDFATYHNATSAVVIDRANGANSTGEAAGDVYANIEAFQLTSYDDQYIGSDDGVKVLGNAGNDTITAGSGDDWLDGGVGADSLDGGAGWDYVTYEDASSAIILDRLTPSNSVGDAAGDTFANIEAFLLTAYDDRYVGDNSTVQVLGGSGSDTIVAGAGNDWLAGGTGNDSLFGGAGYDTYFFNRGDGQDVIVNGVSTNEGESGELDFADGVIADQLWFKQTGSDLIIQIMGSSDQISLSNWYSSDTAKLNAIKLSDGHMIDSGVSQLVQAMATYSSSHTSFNPATATSVPADTSLQNALASSWHT